MVKILVTGGAGYIGSTVVKELLLKGYDVKVFDKLIFGSESLTPFKNKIEVIQGDIRNFDEEILNDVSGVIHLAGFSNDPMADYNPQANKEVNTFGSKKVAEACARKGINRFVYASSASLYDEGTSGDSGLQDENSKVSPRNAYPVSKYEGEQEVFKLMENYPEFCPVILRQATLFGYSPKMRFDLVVNTFVKEAFLNKKLVLFCKGYQWRPLTDVRDMARAHVACIEADGEKIKGQIFNIVAYNYQIMDVAHRVKYALKGIVDDLEIDVDYNENRIDRSYRISGKKIEDVLGFRYKFSLEDSVRDLAERIKRGDFPDLKDSKFYTIKWVDFLDNIKNRLNDMGGSVF